MFHDYLYPFGVVSVGCEMMIIVPLIVKSEDAGFLFGDPDRGRCRLSLSFVVHGLSPFVVGFPNPCCNAVGGVTLSDGWTPAPNRPSLQYSCLSRKIFHGPRKFFLLPAPCRGFGQTIPLGRREAFFGCLYVQGVPCSPCGCQSGLHGSGA